MPFITNTGLRDLKHSEFGTIGDPLVVKEIPDINQDGPGKGVLKQVTARVDDARRMYRLLVENEGKRAAAGNKFLANLALINQQATLAKAQKRDFTGIGRTALQGAADTGKVIASTLAQVPVAGTGTHFVNGGKVGKEYLKGGGNSVGTFLRNLTGVGGGLQGHENVLSGRPIVVNREAVDKNENGSLLQSYEAKIQNEEQRAKPELTKTGDSNLRQPYKNRNNQDTVFFTRLSNQNAYGVDLINQSTIFDEKSKEFTDLRNTDIIPFEFQIFDPEAGGSPKYLLFRAYLTEFQDNYTGDWNATKYIGRAENLYNYTGFNRGFSFGFNLAAQSIEELKPLYKKLNYLVSSTAPSYGKEQTFMRGVFTKVTIGDYLSAVPGFFTNITVSWNTNYPWEIGIGEQYEALTDTIIVPHLLDISLQFQPVHDFNPAIDKPFIGTAEQSSIFDSRQGSGLGTFESSNNEDAKENKNALKEKRTKFGQFLQDKTLAATEQGIPEAVKTINLNSETTSLGLDSNNGTKVDPSRIFASNDSTAIPYRTPLESNPFGG